MWIVFGDKYKGTEGGKKQMMLFMVYLPVKIEVYTRPVLRWKESS